MTVTNYTLSDLKLHTFIMSHFCGSGVWAWLRQLSCTESHKLQSRCWLGCLSSGGLTGKELVSKLTQVVGRICFLVVAGIFLGVGWRPPSGPQGWRPTVLCLVGLLNVTAHFLQPAGSICLHLLKKEACGVMKSPQVWHSITFATFYLLKASHRWYRHC